MPFPLAHPAAVLPLKRYCPRWLCLPALVIGSVAPDAGYLFGEQHAGAFSHRIMGSFAFCLPAGIIMLALFYGLRTPAVKLLPDQYQQVFLPLCRRPLGSPWAIVVSILIGAMTHLLWDAFTHNDGWGVQHLPVLSTVVLTVGSRTARVCHLLWYGCSIAGMMWLFVVFEKWKQTCISGDSTVRRRGMMWDAVLVVLLALPIALVHHFVRSNKPAFYLVAAFFAVPLIGIVLKVSHPQKDASAAKPPTDTR
jgi:hypothetical protein